MNRAGRVVQRILAVLDDEARRRLGRAAGVDTAVVDDLVAAGVDLVLILRTLTSFEWRAAMAGLGSARSEDGAHVARARRSGS